MNVRYTCYSIYTRYLMASGNTDSSFFFLFSLATPVATTDDNEKNDSFAFSVCHNIKSSRNFYFFVNKYLFEFFGFDFGLTQTANRSIIRGEFGEYAAMQKYEVK